MHPLIEEEEPPEAMVEAEKDEATAVEVEVESTVKEEKPVAEPTSELPADATIAESPPEEPSTEPPTEESAAESPANEPSQDPPTDEPTPETLLGESSSPPEESGGDEITPAEVTPTEVEDTARSVTTVEEIPMNNLYQATQFYYEPYMEGLLEEDIEVEEVGTEENKEKVDKCDSKTEMPWEIILLPKGIVKMAATTTEDEEVLFTYLKCILT